MKYILRSLFLILWLVMPTTSQAYTADDFVITVDTTESGSSNNDQFILPTVGGGYDAVVDWGDGATTSLSGSPGNVTHTYPSPGVYEIVITHNTASGFPRINFSSNNDSNKLITISQWGTTEWASLQQAFFDCINMTMTASDEPNLSNVTEMSNMFTGAATFNGDLSAWDVLPAAEVSYIFSGSAFNQDISTWPWLSNPARTSWQGLLAGANEFNQDISDLVLPSNITHLTRLFENNTTFNQDLSSWDVSNVTNMSGLFNQATSFNGDISTWDVSNVTSLAQLLNKATSFNGNLSTWDVSNVTNIQQLFDGASAFNSDISTWDVSNVSNMSYVFTDATAFNQDLSSWDVSNVTSMFNAFDDSGLSRENYSNILNGWAVLPTLQNNVTLGADNLRYLETATTARQYLIDSYGWTINGDNVYLEPSDDVFVTVWDTRLDPSTPNDLQIYVSGGSNYNFTIDWGDGTIDTYTTDPDDYISHTYSTPGIKTVTIQGLFPYFYPGCADGDQYNKLIDVVMWGTGQWESFSYSFYGCTNLTGFSATDAPDLSAVTSMSEMFFGATAFNGDLSSWDVSNVEDMRSMFFSASAFNGDLSSWDVSNVTDMEGMFAQASSFNGDLSSWDVSNVTITEPIFRGTAFSTSNYTKLLLNWSLLTLQNGGGVGLVGGTYDADLNDYINLTSYCSSAQSARDIMTGTYSWSFTDGGSVPCKTATYLIEGDGSITGDSFQYIVDGEGGSAVTAVPANGSRFIGWSDGVTANPRTDGNLTVDISVTALFESTNGGNNSSATRVGERDKSMVEKLTAVPVVGSIATFIVNVKNFLNYLSENEDELEKLTPEERTQVIIALRNIVVFLLTLIPGV